MQKNNILHIAYFGMGGTTDYVINLIKGDSQKLFNHYLLFYGNGELSNEHKAVIESTALKTVFIRKRYRIDIGSLFEIREYIKNISPKYITLHINSLIPYSIFWKTSFSKIIFVEHQANHLKSKKEWVFSYLAQKIVYKVVCLTKEYFDDLNRGLNQRLNENKTLIIPTGINIDVLKNTAQSDINITMIARFNEFRDQEGLIKAFLMLKNNKAILHLAGDGPKMKVLKKNYKAKNIIFYGNIGPIQIEQLLSKTSIYVQATYGETSSVAIMQAQAHSLPIIATDVKGVNNQLKAEQAILVEVDNEKMLCDAMASLLVNSDLRQHYSRKSADFAKTKLDRKKMFLKYKDIMK